MRKTPNSVRIQVMRRGIVSANFKEDKQSSLNVQEQTHHQPVREHTNHQLEKEQANHHPAKEQVRDYSSFSLNITKPREIRRLLTRNTPKLLNES